MCKLLTLLSLQQRLATRGPIDQSSLCSSDSSISSVTAATGPQKKNVVDLTKRGGLPGLAGLGNRKRGSVDAFMLPLGDIVDAGEDDDHVRMRIAKRPGGGRLAVPPDLLHRLLRRAPDVGADVLRAVVCGGVCVCVHLPHTPLSQTHARAYDS